MAAQSSALIHIRPSVSPWPDSEEPQQHNHAATPLPSEDVQISILNRIRRFVRPDVAARAHRIPMRTWTEWMNLGASGVPGYAEFFRDVQAAAAQAEALAVESIVDRVMVDPSNAKWLLERGRAENWAPQVRIAVEQELLTIYQKLQANLEPALFERVLGIIGGESVGSSTATPETVEASV